MKKFSSLFTPFYKHALGAILLAAGGAVAAPSEANALGDAYIGVGPTVSVFDYGDVTGKLSSATLFGGAFSGGFYISQEKPFWKNVLFYGELGFLTGASSSVVVASYSDAGGEASVSAKLETTAVPVLLNLAYEFHLGESFDVRVGPTLGGTYLSGKLKYSGHAREGDEHRSDSYSKSDSVFVFTGGVALAGSWRFAERWSLDLQYRFAFNSGADYSFGDAGSSTAHQFNLGVRWKF